MEIHLNGDARTVPTGLSLAQLISELNLDGRRLAAEVNGAIVPESLRRQHKLSAGDRVEIVHAIGGGAPGAMNSGQNDSDALVIAGHAYTSRLLVGTGKYRDLDETGAAIAASGAQIVTVAIRRTNIGQNPGEPNLLDVISPDQYTILPNTAGCFTAADALRTCRLARELLDDHRLVKLEVLGDPKTLYPDMPATLEAAQTLVTEGFEVMVYCNDDPIACKRLEQIGCVAVMPLAAPIGSGLGVQNRYNIAAIVAAARVPILVDAGVGTPSDAAIAMELGCDGVLMNTAIAEAGNPVMMAMAMRHAVLAGRLGWLAHPMPRRGQASASSPAPD